MHETNEIITAQYHGLNDFDHEIHETHENSQHRESVFFVIFSTTKHPFRLFRAFRGQKIYGQIFQWSYFPLTEIANPSATSGLTISSISALLTAVSFSSGVGRSSE